VSRSRVRAYKPPCPQRSIPTPRPVHFEGFTPLQILCNLKSAMTPRWYGGCAVVHPNPARRRRGAGRTAYQSSRCAGPPLRRQLRRLHAGDRNASPIPSIIEVSYRYRAEVLKQANSCFQIRSAELPRLFRTWPSRREAPVSHAERLLSSQESGCRLELLWHTSAVRSCCGPLCPQLVGSAERTGRIDNPVLA
jgi:hypothetical protein